MIEKRSQKIFGRDLTFLSDIIDKSKYKFYYQSRAPNSNADQLMLTCNFLNVVLNGLIEHFASILNPYP